MSLLQYYETQFYSVIMYTKKKTCFCLSALVNFFLPIQLANFFETIGELKKKKKKTNKNKK